MSPASPMGTSSVLVILSMLAPLNALPPLPLTGCPTSACTAHRDGRTPSLVFGEPPQALWKETAIMKASQCSGNGELAICTVDDGSLAAFNVSGLTWHTDAAIKAGNASSHAPFITRPSRLAVAGAIEGAGATKSVVVRSMDLGGVAYQLQLEEGAIGPWLLSNANPEDSLMLVVQVPDLPCPHMPFVAVRALPCPPCPPCPSTPVHALPCPSMPLYALTCPSMPFHAIPSQHAIHCMPLQPLP